MLPLVDGIPPAPIGLLVAQKLTSASFGYAQLPALTKRETQIQLLNASTESTRPDPLLNTPFSFTHLLLFRLHIYFVLLLNAAFPHTPTEFAH